MEMAIPLTIAAALLGLATPSAWSAAEQIYAPRMIDSISTYANGAAIKYSPPDTAHGCAGASAASFVWIDWATNVNSKGQLATVMLAHAAGKAVGFGVDGCYSSYGGGVPVVYRVDVLQ